MDWEELRRFFDTDVSRDRAHRLVEAIDCVLGLEHGWRNPQRDANRRVERLDR